MLLSLKYLVASISMCQEKKIIALEKVHNTQVKFVTEGSLFRSCQLLMFVLILHVSEMIE